MTEKHQPGFMPWDRSGNRILVQSKLGKSKPTAYEIPEENFIYGKPTGDDPEKANHLMYAWKTHQTSANFNEGKTKDLLETNKRALSQMLHRSNQFSDFRKTNTLFKAAKEGSNVMKISLPEASHSYGKPLDLEDPVRLVIANNYGQNDRIARHSFYKTKSMSMASSQVNRKLSCHITKNHQLVKEATARRMEQFDWDKKQNLWKISRFDAQAVAKVDHRRTSKIAEIQDGASRNSAKGSNSYHASSISAPVEDKAIQ